MEDEAVVRARARLGDLERALRDRVAVIFGYERFDQLSRMRQEELRVAVREAASAFARAGATYVHERKTIPAPAVVDPDRPPGGPF